jgi:hypothetical protein
MIIIQKGIEKTKKNLLEIWATWSGVSLAEKPLAADL